MLMHCMISSVVNTLGKRPFAGCDKINGISFQGGEYFVCDNAIIYELENGEKVAIVEGLESRGVTTGSSTTSPARSSTLV